MISGRQISMSTLLRPTFLQVVQPSLHDDGLGASRLLRKFPESASTQRLHSEQGLLSDSVTVDHEHWSERMYFLDPIFIQPSLCHRTIKPIKPAESSSAQVLGYS